MLKFGLRQLEHFVAVAEAGSFRAAADRIGIAQPALSMSIRKLEEALGLSLFDRGIPGVRGVGVSPAGQALLEEARRSLEHAHLGQQGARLAALGEWGTVRLGFVGSAVYRYLPSRLPAFMKRYPNVKLVLSEGATTSLAGMIRAGRVDAAVIRTPLEDTSELRVADVEKDGLVAVVPAGHRLAGRRRIDLASLSEDPFVMFSRDEVPGLREIIFAVCRSAGFVPRVAQDVTQAFTMVGLVGSGIGVALLPGVISQYSHQTVRFIQLSDRAARDCLTLSFAISAHRASASTLRLFEAMTM